MRKCVVLFLCKSVERVRAVCTIKIVLNGIRSSWNGEYEEELDEIKHHFGGNEASVDDGEQFTRHSWPR